jgi:hypothetical protein
VKTLPFPVNENGPVLARSVSLTEAAIQFDATADCSVNGKAIPFRQLGDEYLDQPQRFFTGIKPIRPLRSIGGGITRVPTLLLESNDPLPCNILAMEVYMRFK